MLNFPTQETTKTVRNLVCTIEKAVFSFIAIEINPDVHQAVFASACSSQHRES
jgi:hypothetical protein